MLLRNEAKVGIVIFLAILVLIGVYWFLGSLSLSGSTYNIYAMFSDVRKLDKGSDVRMAGVKVGYVSKIQLTSCSQARVDMLIFNDTLIPVNSVARITQGGFIGDYYVDILPGNKCVGIKENHRIAGEEPVQYDKIIADVSVLLGQLKVSVSGINQLLGDKQTIATVKDTIAQLDIAAASANKLIQSAQSMLGQASPEIQKAFANLNTATANAAQISRDIHEAILTEARPNLSAILRNAREASSNLSATTLQAQKILSSFGQSAGKLDTTFNNINTTTEQAAEMMKNFNAASSGIKDIATDQQIRCDLKQTIANISQATEQIKELTTSINCRFGKNRPGPTPEEKAAIPQRGIYADALWRTNNGDYRVDANYTFPGSDRNFYRIGAFNIGESTKLNLQAGKTLDQYTAIRYGLYASRLDIGADRRFGNRFLVSGDLFRPNDPELELRGVFGITDQFGLYGGVEDLFDEQNVLVGVTYQK